MLSNLPHPPLSYSAPGRSAPGSRLALGLAAIGVIWLVVLPALAEVSTIRTTIDRHEAHGVDPSAKFYSEVPAMPMIIRQVDEIRWSQPAAFGLEAAPKGGHSERSEESGSSQEPLDPSLRSG